MSAGTTTTDTALARPDAPGGGLLARWRRHDLARRERQRVLRRQQLDVLQVLLSSARSLVEANWIQGAWFEYTDHDGATRLAAGGWASRIRSQDVTGACLVGALVMAGGGPAAVQSESVQRAIDVTWHALRQQEADVVRWCPDPASRMANVRDLTQWNDSAERGAAEVASLLLTAERLVSRELLAV